MRSHRLIATKRLVVPTTWVFRASGSWSASVQLALVSAARVRVARKIVCRCRGLIGPLARRRVALARDHDRFRLFRRRVEDRRALLRLKLNLAIRAVVL